MQHTRTMMSGPHCPKHGVAVSSKHFGSTRGQHIYKKLAMPSKYDAAVLFHGKRVSHCKKEVPEQLCKGFSKRNDDQIMALEMCAILAGLLNFESEIKQQNVRIYTDNVGGKCALRKQTAKAADHNRLVHRIWAVAAEMGIGLWFERVPSAENIADGPTRPNEEIEMSILNKCKSRECVCKLPSELF